MSTPGMRALVDALQIWLDQPAGSPTLVEPKDQAVSELLGMLQTPAAPEAEAAFADFEVVREIGRGGMGVVYEATQRTLARRVALKVLHEGFGSNPSALRRFRREAQTLGRLDHPGIVRVLDVGEDRGRHWLAMEFVEGASLAHALADLRAHGGHGKDSRRQMLVSVAEVAEALHFAHGAGVVHRDIKPQNVLLRHDGRAVLGDFGLARDAQDLTMTQAGAVAGTPSYMSPEQVAGRSAECDARSDVFSLGSMLYECITLRLPFDGPTSEIVQRQILHAEPRDPRRWQKGLPAELAAITLKALEKDPARRYASAHAFADDLRAFLDLRPVQAQPPSRVRRVARWVRREPLRAALAVALMCAVLLGGVYMTRLPDIRAGELARRERAYEDALANAFAARSSNDRERAFAGFAAALDLFPDRSEAIAMRCLCIQHFDGPDAAMADLERDDLLRREDSDLPWLRVLVQRRRGETDAAEQLEHSLGEPRSPASLWLAALRWVDDPDATPADQARALALVSLACRIAPEPRLWLHLQWAACARGAHDPTAEREGAEALVRLWPDQPVALQYAAAALEDVDPPRAAALQQSAIDLGLADPRALRNLSAYLLKAGRTPDWIAPMRRHLELHPDDTLRNDFIDRLAMKGNSDDYAIEVEKWLRDAPDHPLALRQAGRLATGRRDAELARALLNRVATLLPDDPESHFDLAVLVREANQSECVEHLANALELDPAHKRAHDFLLSVLGEAEDWAALRGELDRWLRLQPDDAIGWQQLARALVKLGEPSLLPEALLALQRADVLTRGAPEVLRAEATVLDKLGCGPAAEVCRARAAQGTTQGR